MKIINEIMLRLDKMARLFPNYRFNYWINKSENDHIIEVNPSSFENDHEFSEYESNFLDELFDLNEDLNISFLCSDDIYLKDRMSLEAGFNYKIKNWSSLSGMESKQKEDFIYPITINQEEYNYSFAA